jgi:hypothetical protein
MSGKVFLDLPVPWDRLTDPGSRVPIPIVPATVTKKNAAALFNGAY